MTIPELIEILSLDNIQVREHLEEGLYELQSEIIAKERTRCIGLVRMYTTNYLATIEAIAMGDIVP